MGDKNNFDDYIKMELEKTYASPEHLNNNLILNMKEKEEFKITNFMFFIIAIIQSLSIIFLAIIFISDILLKITIIGAGILLFNLSVGLYILTINKDGVLI